YLVHLFSPLGVDPQVLMRRLVQEPDISVRRALLLSLGEFPAERLKGSAGKDLVMHLSQLFRNDADGGIHSAVEWLLGRWGRETDHKPLKEQLAPRDPPDNRQWYVNGEGHTLVIIPGPAEFFMGSPGYEPGRIPKEEALWRARIPR